MFQEFSGLDYLRIDVANNFGHDRQEWDFRIAWFNEHESLLEGLIKEAAEPALFFAGVQAYRKACKGEVITYPISLDATSSGIQILACLTGDRQAAKLCNVVDTGKREDAYTGLYDTMVAKLGGKAKIERKSTKQAIMTAFYNSTAMPKKIFGEGELLNIFYETMKENAPGPWELTETMLNIWDPTKYSNDWIMPDNFNVKVKVMSNVTEMVNFINEPFEVSYSVNRPMDNGRSLGANMVHSIDGMLVREMDRRCNYNVASINKIKYLINSNKPIVITNNREKDKLLTILHDHYRDSGFLSARILDYIDEFNIDLVNHKAILRLINSLPKKPFQVISVHDCFRCLPNYGNDLRRQYNQLLSEVAKSELLSFLISQMLHRIVPVSKLDPSLWKDILNTNYALS
jgi:hypothetical protein